MQRYGTLRETAWIHQLISSYLAFRTVHVRGLWAALGREALVAPAAEDPLVSSPFAPEAQTRCVAAC